ncbi:MAG: N-acetyl-gamma-glutamyl-phosphate reductase [Actinomycetaceae bacterium]|nr:N-acetyl-gamma-glutamyl-phosphate reductase [Actinomycetaceae bacterium]MDY6142957.1 N-acetyl-gamma-glutamyl-phosphate reductase [Arcanobacterium sp.]
MSTIHVAVAGASGYAGGEVLRLISQIPQFEVGALCAHTSSGALSNHQPHIASLAKRSLEPISAERLAEHDVVFIGLPHGKSAELAAQIDAINPQTIIVDLGADHRLLNGDDWREYYGSEPSEPWAYGMPELYRKHAANKQLGGEHTQREILASSRHIAAPGCNASAVTFAAQPAVAASISDGNDLVAVLAVGYSGAGKALKPHLLASEAFNNATPYSVAGTHRHIPEIAQNLKIAGAAAPAISFTPVLVPMARGILATVSMPVQAGTTGADVIEAYREFLDGEPFVQWTDSWPRVDSTIGANTAVIHAELDRDARRLTAVCALDNLVKGTAGAAIQSLNLALGIEETNGLPVNGVAP